tara:strand:+ start:1673 stop:1990 length:318 start_codon:yes stop_codon:yes gene_type:complete
MTELKNYVELEHIATGYPVVIALNSKECQLLSHYYNVREDEVISYEDFKSYESEAYESLEKRMQLNGDLQEDEGLFENYFIEKLKFQDEYGKTIISDNQGYTIAS